MSSLTKACLELSNSLKGLRLSRSSEPPSPTQPTDDVTRAKDATSPTKPTVGGKMTSPTQPNVTSSIGGKTKTRDADNNTRVTSSDFASSLSRVFRFASNKMKGGMTSSSSSTSQSSDAKNGNETPTPSTTPKSPLSPRSPTLAKFPLASPKSPCKVRILRLPPPRAEVLEHWTRNEQVLVRVFAHLPVSDRLVVAQVCRLWRQVAYRESLWSDASMVYACRLWSEDMIGRSLFFKSLTDKQCTSIIMEGATDDDVADFVNNFPRSRNDILEFTLRRSNVTDTGLAHLLTHMEGVSELSIECCNDISDSALYICLKERLLKLAINDCLNIGDDSVAAIAQLLPNLCEFSLQAYEISDAAMSFFSARQSQSISVCRLTSCLYITNQGVVNLVNSLPNLTVVSLSGCSKITDDAVELLAQKLTRLTSLDLSWCPRVANGALAAVARHSKQLEHLLLDRYWRCCDFYMQSEQMPYLLVSDAVS